MFIFHLLLFSFLLEYNCFRPGGSVGKDLPAVQKTQVRSLGREHPLEKRMATHFRVLAWEIPSTEEPGPRGHKELDTTEQLTISLFIIALQHCVV